MKKICFIACVNDDIIMDECRLYIERLYVPKGWIVEIITIKEAPSMAEGYNTAMEASDAEIKVYLHQDVFIINRRFLENIIRIFESDAKIGIIGMVGVRRLARNGVMWRGGAYCGNLFRALEEKYEEEEFSDLSLLNDVICADGFCLATSKNVFWRKDLFDKFDFYDVSECFEYRRKGYKVVVPTQKSAWCVHDDGKILKLFDYNEYRKKFIKEYGKERFDLNDENCKEVTNAVDDEFVEMLQDLEEHKDYYVENQRDLINDVEKCLHESDVDGFISLDEKITSGIKEKKLKLSKEIMIVKMLSAALLSEKKLKFKPFISGMEKFSQLREKWFRLDFYLRRLEFNLPEALQQEGIKYIDDNEISPYIIAMVIYGTISYIGHREMIILKIAEYYMEKGDIRYVYCLLGCIVNPSNETKLLIKDLEKMVEH